LVSNRANCKAVSFAKKNNIDVYIVEETKPALSNDEIDLLNVLIEYKADLLVLAGYLKLISIPIIDCYQNKILNIHPSLLPKYGGKGYYGQRVHRAVLNSGEKESGITIHLVNEKYDEGFVLFQKKIFIDRINETSDLSAKILELEHFYYSKVIALFCLNKIRWKNNKPQLIEEKDFEYEVCNN